MEKLEFIGRILHNTCVLLLHKELQEHGPLSSVKWVRTECSAFKCETQSQLSSQKHYPFLARRTLFEYHFHKESFNVIIRLTKNASAAGFNSPAPGGE